MPVATAFNVGSFLTTAAGGRGGDTALIFKRGSRYQRMRFDELDRLCDGYAHGLRRHGLERGQRVLMMVRNGPEFVALTFALFKIGAIPVLIDPGMGLKMLLACVRHLQPEALVGIRAAHVIRTVFGSSFRSVRRAVSVGGGGFGAVSLDSLVRGGDGPFPMAVTAWDETAAILFTSGSTGPAKGVVYRHGIFSAQVDALREMFSFVPGEIDMPGFPLFALFSTALGVPCLIPDLNPSRPGRCDPARIVPAIQEFKVASLQGSPAIWTRVASWCKARGVRLPSVRRVITFGAPIQVDLIRTWHEVMSPEGEIYTPYGATEALPVACIGGREILGETAALSAQGAGTCVGLPAPGITVRVVRISDGAIPEWTPDLELPRGEIGEIVVAGEVVTWSYDGLPEATAASKIRDGARVWHRMGDVGYFDERGRLWFCGRKAHRVESAGKTYFSVNAEGMADVHPAVRRSALVGVDGEPVLVIEPSARVDASSVLELLTPHPLYGDVRRALVHDRPFPTDPRHNAKIHREDLAAWAKRRLR